MGGALGLRVARDHRDCHPNAPVSWGFPPFSPSPAKPSPTGVGRPRCVLHSCLIRNKPRAQERFSKMTEPTAAQFSLADVICRVTDAWLPEARVYAKRHSKTTCDFPFDTSPHPHSLAMRWHYYYVMKTIIHSLLKENNSIDLLNSVFYSPLNFYGA